MRNVLLSLALGVLAGGLAAQTPVQKLHADKVGGVAVKVVKGAQKVYHKGYVTKPILLSVFEKGMGRMDYAYAKIAAGLHRSMGHHYRSGAYLAVYGKVYGKGQAKSNGAKFTWTYRTGKPLNGYVKAYFHGFIYGPAVLGGFIGKKSFAWKKPGRYNFTVTLPVKNMRSISLSYGLTGSLVSTSARGRGYFNGTISFQFFPAAVQPGLKWVDPRQVKNCAAGKLAHRGEVGFGKKFYVTLSGATDLDPAKHFAMLFIGNSNKKFFFLNLPLNLTSAGAPGCYLFTNIVAVRLAKVVKGAAAVPFMIPGHGWYARFFKPLYFQYAYPSKKNRKNRLGLVLTNYAAVVKK